MTEFSLTFSLTVKLQFMMKGGDLTLLDGPLLQNTYTFDHINFHWRKMSEQGSETKIDGKPFALEMHWVFYNIKYDDLIKAAEEKDGIAALSFLFEVADEDNESYKSIVEALPDIPKKEDVTEIKDVFTPESLIDSVSGSNYYTYQGSLTIAPCSRHVQWLVFASPMTISEKQVRHNY